MGQRGTEKERGSLAKPWHTQKSPVNFPLKFKIYMLSPLILLSVTDLEMRGFFFFPFSSRP